MNDKELFLKYLDKVGSIKDQRYFLMNEDIYHGQTSYLRMKFKGSSIFNPEWIRRIEDCMYELDQITNNPREVTTTEGSVMPIELAKKINYESVQHLASHSQFIKEIKDNGDVVPAKILGLYNKEELHTYENRFIATFIRRLILFIDKRYEFIKKTVSLDEKEIMYVKNKSIVDGQEVEIETKITVKRALEDDLSIAAREYIARIDKLKEYIGYYYNSPFMKEFKTEKDVRRPILLTNIIKKNPLYHKCYETFLFIEKFDSLGVAFKVDRNFQEFNEKERKDLGHILLSNLLFLENTENDKVYKQVNKVYKPKLLHSIDDESFIYDDLVKGPVDFVRADESYINYLNKLSPKDLPAKPNRSEKAYYQDEYKLKKDISDEIKSIEALLNRIRKAIEKYEKKVAKLIEQRNYEEAEAYKAKIAELRQQQEDILNQKRAEIIAAAKGDYTDNKKYKKPKKAAKTKEIPAKPAQNEEIQPEPVIEEPVIEQPISEPENIEGVQNVEPILSEEKVEEISEQPVKEEEPIEEEKSAPKQRKPRKKSPAKKKVTKKKETKPEEPTAPIEDIKSEPVSEPVIEENVPEPVTESPIVEEPVKEEPKEEAPIAEEKPVEPVKKKTKAKKKAPAKKKATPKKEEKPKEEPKTVKPVEEPKSEEPKPVKKAAKKKPAPKKKPEPKKAPAPKKKAKPAKEELAPIPGKFIVKTNEGYYINSKKTSIYKNDAHIFDDFNKANEIKNKMGGKVVKL